MSKNFTLESFIYDVHMERQDCHRFTDPEFPNYPDTSRIFQVCWKQAFHVATLEGPGQNGRRRGMSSWMSVHLTKILCNYRFITLIYWTGIIAIRSRGKPSRKIHAIELTIFRSCNQPSTACPSYNLHVQLPCNIVPDWKTLDPFRRGSKASFMWRSITDDHSHECVNSKI